MKHLLVVFGESQCLDLLTPTYRFIIPLFYKDSEKLISKDSIGEQLLRDVRIVKMSENNFVLKIEIKNIESIIPVYKALNWEPVNGRINRGWLIFSKRKLMNMVLNDILDESINFSIHRVGIIRYIKSDDDLLDSFFKHL